MMLLGSISNARRGRGGSAPYAEYILPDAITTQTNLSGSLGASLAELADNANGTWLTAVDDALDTVLTVTFPSPTGTLIAGANNQEIRAYVRKGSVAGGGDPTVTLELMNDSTSAATLVTAQTITTETGIMISGSFNSTILSGVTGARITGTRSGGSPANRRTIEIDAVSWTAYVT